MAEGFSGWRRRTKSDLVGESCKDPQGLSDGYVASWSRTVSSVRLGEAPRTLAETRTFLSGQ